MSLNRAIAPGFAQIEKLTIPEAELFKLSNGIPVYFIDAGDEPVIKLDIYFNAGTKRQEKKCQAGFTSQMLGEGTRKHSAEELANALDYYGSYFQPKCTVDEASFALFCLSKHLNFCLPFVEEILTESNFPENELETVKRNALQRLSVNEMRNSYLARRYFNAEVFGKTSPYGSYYLADDIKLVETGVLASFYNKTYLGGIKHIFISGKVDKTALNTLDQHFGKSDFGSDYKATTSFENKTDGAVTSFFEKPGSLQSAIRIGRQIVNRKHHDYRELSLLNLILGGYFGSRLMTNIREEKGLTYGIYSSIESYQDNACWYVETDMNNELVVVGTAEIYNEIQRLIDEPIPEEELKTAKSYMLGSFLRNFDGPFSLMERYKILHDYGFSYQYYHEYVDLIKSVSPTRLQELASIYFNRKDLSEIIVGSKSK